MRLAQSLLERKLTAAGTPVFLSSQEAKNLCGDREECTVSLQELNIFLPSPDNSRS